MNELEAARLEACKSFAKNIADDRRKIRRLLIAEIKQNVKPHMHQSSIVSGPGIDGPDRFMPMVILKQEITLPYHNEQVEGFTDIGVITDSAFGGIVVMRYNQICIEALEKLLKVSTNLANTKKAMTA